MRLCPARWLFICLLQRKHQMQNLCRLKTRAYKERVRLFLYFFILCQALTTFATILASRSASSIQHVTPPTPSYMSSPLSSTVTKTYNSKGQASRLNKSACNQAIQNNRNVSYALQHEDRTAAPPVLSQGNDACSTFNNDECATEIGQKSLSETVRPKNLSMVREACAGQILPVVSDAVGVQVSTPPVAMPRFVVLSRFRSVHHLAVPINGASCAGTTNPAPGRCYPEET